MDWLRQLRFKLFGLWRDRTLEADMAEEMRMHLERLAAANRAAGMPPDKARDAALRQFGNVSSLQERTRDERRFRTLQHLVQDLRYAARQLRLNPGFASTAILSLALGIGASVAIFSAVSAILFRDLALPDAGRLAVVWKGPVGGALSSGIAPANALEVAAQARPFGSVTPFTMTQFEIREDMRAERVSGMRVGPSFFTTLGIEPALGRDLLPADDRAGAGPVAIISSALWERRFARDPHVLGRALTVGSRAPTIVGVLPDGFRFPELFGTTVSPEVWVPLAFSPGEAQTRGAGYMFLLLKRPHEWSWQSVQRELDAIARAYEKLEPRAYGHQQLRAVPVHEQVVGDARPMLLLLWAAVSCVLLIACANAANLVLSRTSARSRELAIRASTGASRGRLFCQLVTESVLLAVIAATIGLLIAAVMVSLASHALAEFIPRAEEMTIDWWVLVFTIATVTFTSVAVGVLPAVRLSAVSPRAALGEAATRATTEGPLASGVSRLLLVVQIAVAVLLAAVAALLGRSFAAVQRVDLGFRPEALLTFELSLPEGGGGASELTSFYDQLTEHLESRPQVSSVGALSLLPLSGGDFSWTFLVRDKPVPDGMSLPRADVRIVTPGALETLAVPIRQGRSFQRSDRPDGQPVAIVNETLARGVWPGEDPIGKQLKLAGSIELFPWMTVIAVAGDVRFGSPDRAAAPAIYRPQAQHPRRDMAVVVRTRGRPADIVPAVFEDVKRLGGGASVLGVRDFSFYLSRSIAERRLVTVLVVVFAAIALSLALVGVYGLFAYAVTSRTREMGVRIALGAGRARVVWIMMRQALLLGTLGLVVGLAGVLAARRLIETQLFEIRAIDPWTLTAISLTVLATALVASYVPARRAARVDPTTALRAE